jgi:hypothetical protein
MGDAVHHRERQQRSFRAHGVETEQAWRHEYPARWPDAIQRRMVLVLAPTRAAASKMDVYCRRLARGGGFMEYRPPCHYG